MTEHFVCDRKSLGVDSSSAANSNLKLVTPPQPPAAGHILFWSLKFFKESHYSFLAEYTPQILLFKFVQIIFLLFPLYHVKKLSEDFQQKVETCQ